MDVPARNRKVLAAGASAGMVAGSLLLGIRCGPGAISVGATAGALLGLGAGALLLALTRRPLLVIAALQAVSPLAFVAGQLLVFPALGLMPVGLLALAALWLATYPQARAMLAPDLATGAVIVYGLLVAFGLRNLAPEALVPAACVSLLPISLYFAGMMLPALAKIDPTGGGQNQLAENTPHAQVLRAHVLAEVCVALSFAVLVAVPAAPLPHTIPRQMPALSASFPGADSVPMAHALGAALVILLTWDSRGAIWRAVLGPGRAQEKSTAYLWPLLRRLIIGIVVVVLALLLGELVLVWSRFTLLALGIAVVWALLSSRRYGMLVAFVLLALPLVAIVPYVSSAAQVSAADVLPDAAVWHQALAAVTSPSPGPGFSASDFIPGAGAYYLVILHALGLPGLMALLSLLIIAFARMWRARLRLRVLSGEAGATTAGGALLLFVAAASLTTSPLMEPLTSLLFWLVLGLANGIASGLEAGTMATSAARDFPLRVAYILHSDEDDETPLALFDLLHALDRRHVTPLLIAVGPTPLVAHARNLQISCRVIPPRDPDALGVSLQWAASERKLMRWLAGNPFANCLLGLGDRAIAALDRVRRNIGIARALFELRPDLVVSNSAATHCVTLATSAFSGVPVAWHLRASPPAQLQPLLDALVPWTAVALVPSQAVARAFRPGVLAHGVRVVRPGIAAPEPAAPGRRAELRRIFGVSDDATVLIQPALPPSVNAHLELMQTLTSLRKRYPSLHLVMAYEELVCLPAPDDAPQSPCRERQIGERLRQTLTLGSSQGLVTWVGGCGDLTDLLAMGDVVIVPLTATPSNRMLLHAMASGVPILAPRVEAVEELLAGAWGYKLVASAKPEALAESLSELLHDLERYQTEARRNPGVVRDWYTSALEAGRLVTVYKRVCMPPRLLERRKLFQRKRTRFPRGWLSTLRQLAGEDAQDA